MSSAEADAWTGTIDFSSAKPREVVESACYVARLEKSLEEKRRKGKDQEPAAPSDSGRIEIETDEKVSLLCLPEEDESVASFKTIDESSEEAGSNTAVQENAAQNELRREETGDIAARHQTDGNKPELSDDFAAIEIPDAMTIDAAFARNDHMARSRLQAPGVTSSTATLFARASYGGESPADGERALSSLDRVMLRAGVSSSRRLQLLNFLRYQLRPWLGAAAVVARRATALVAAAIVLLIAFAVGAFGGQAEGAAAGRRALKCLCYSCGVVFSCQIGESGTRRLRAAARATVGACCWASRRGLQERPAGGHSEDRSVRDEGNNQESSEGPARFGLASLLPLARRIDKRLLLSVTAGKPVVEAEVQEDDEDDDVNEDAGPQGRRHERLRDDDGDF